MEQKRLNSIRVNRNLLCRLLYPNPVCLLSICSSSHEGRLKRNVMPITWLTCINNEGDFVCSINEKRFTSSFFTSTNVQEPIYFVLNVPVKGMENEILEIGNCSGREGDKIDYLNISVCRPGWRDFDMQSSSLIAATNITTKATTNITTNTTTNITTNITTKATTPSIATAKTQKSKKQIKEEELRTISNEMIALTNCVSHLLCRVQEMKHVGNHLLLICRMVDGYVQKNYWSGKNFLPVNPEDPPYLTFLGTKVFATVQKDIDEKKLS